MDLRTRFTEAMKASMIAGTAPRTSTIRMIIARMKDSDIAARPGPPLDDAALVGMLRGMVKSRRESVDMYTQGNRPELAEKEMAEIAVIEEFLPRQMDEAAMTAAVAAAVAEAGATSIKEMGKVMAVLKTRHTAEMDMGRAGPMVKAALSA